MSVRKYTQSAEHCSTIAQINHTAVCVFVCAVLCLFPVRIRINQNGEINRQQITVRRHGTNTRRRRAESYIGTMKS